MATTNSHPAAGRLLAAAVSLSLAAACLPGGDAAAAGRIPDTALARLEMTALLQTLNAELLSRDSATRTLEVWCVAHHFDAAGHVRAERLAGAAKPASPEVRRDLSAGAGEPIGYRRVRLWCGGRVLSEADNWYRPRLLTPEMNRLLEATDTPFGRVVAGLGFSRHTLAAELLWTPLPAGWEMSGLPPDGTGTLPIPTEILRHRAVLTTRDGAAFSEVVETYRGAMFDFALPRR